MNTTIRLCRALRHLVSFAKDTENISNDLKHLVYKVIYDNIYFILHKNKTLNNTQVETLYLLIALGQLGKEYWLEPNVLCQHFNIDNSEDKPLSTKGELNYFAITVLLFYMKNKKRYIKINDFLKSHIFAKFEKLTVKSLEQSTELTLLLFDCLTCPYLDLPFKRKLLSLYEISDKDMQLKIITNRTYWFTKWTNFDFGRELDSKHSQEVY